MTDINLAIGKRIRHRRRSLGLTQRQLAERVGCSHQMVQKSECAATSLSVVRAYDYARALELEPPASLFEGIG